MIKFSISLWQIFKSTYKLWLIVSGVVLFQILVEKLFAWLENWIDKRWLKKHKRLVEWITMDDKKFERIVAIIFEGLGYKTKVVGGPGDMGIDVIAYKDGKRFFIQCKRKDRIPPREVREFAGSIRNLNKEKGERGFFVTTGEFTEEGKFFAKNNPIEIELINGLELEKLAKLIEKQN